MLTKGLLTYLHFICTNTLKLGSSVGKCSYCRPKARSFGKFYI